MMCAGVHPEIFKGRGSIFQKATNTQLLLIDVTD